MNTLCGFYKVGDLVKVFYSNQDYCGRVLEVREQGYFCDLLIIEKVVDKTQRKKLSGLDEVETLWVDKIA